MGRCLGSVTVQCSPGRGSTKFARMLALKLQACMLFRLSSRQSPQHKCHPAGAAHPQFTTNFEFVCVCVCAMCTCASHIKRVCTAGVPGQFSPGRRDCAMLRRRWAWIHVWRRLWKNLDLYSSVSSTSAYGRRACTHICTRA